MQVISIHSHKGGAGKTTLSLTIARRLAEAGQKVCLVDLDFLGAGIDPAIKVTKPAHFLEEILLAAAGSSSGPPPEALLGQHSLGNGAQPIAVILNTGQQTPDSAPGGEEHMAQLHRGIVRLLGLEEETGILRRGTGSLLDDLEKLGFDKVILDCHPTLEEISETVFRVQMARTPEQTAVVLVSTADRAHVHGLLKEMQRRTKSPKQTTLNLDRTVLVINKVEPDEQKRPYGSTLDSYADLAVELKADPVVGDDAPAVVNVLKPKHYCRILRDDQFTSAAFAVRSSGDIPKWPPAILTHSGTPLCEDLFGKK